MGPPTEPPNVLRINLPGTFGKPLASCACLLNQLFALPKFVLLYSKASPRKLLEPDLVTSETCAPDERPAAASLLTVATRNSSVESMVERSTPVKAYPWV